MHIAYVLSQYPARSETFVAREMRELSARGHDLTIARLRWSDTAAGVRAKDAEVLRLQWNPLDWMFGLAWAALRTPRCLLQMGRDLFSASLLSDSWWRLLVLGLISVGLARTLNHRSVEHLRAHFLDSEAIAAYWIGELLDVPFSVTLHTKEARFPASLLEQVARNASFSVVISRETAAFAAELVDPQRIRLIRNGIRIPDPHSSSFPASPPTWRLVAVGRLVEKKGFDVLLQGCQILTNWMYPFRCDIVGDGPLRKPLSQQACALNLDDVVHFHGAQPNREVLRSIRCHDVLVMPSKPARDGTRDGIPTVLIEAMGHGTPVVASDFAGIPDLVRHGETGLLATPQSPIALAQALSTLFNRPRWAGLMRVKAHDHVRRHFNLEREVRRLDDTIQKTVLLDG